MKKTLSAHKVIIDLHERGYCEDFSMNGNDLVWLQERKVVLAGSFRILEYYRFFNEKMNDTFIIFGIAAIYKNIKGILTCRCSNSCLLVPPVIIKKLSEMNMDIQWDESVLVENNN
jgi:hypothetical protein